MQLSWLTLFSAALAFYVGMAAVATPDTSNFTPIHIDKDPFSNNCDTSWKDTSFHVCLHNNGPLTNAIKVGIAQTANAVAKDDTLQDIAIVNPLESTVTFSLYHDDIRITYEGPSENQSCYYVTIESLTGIYSVDIVDDHGFVTWSAFPGVNATYPKDQNDRKPICTRWFHVNFI